MKIGKFLEKYKTKAGENQKLISGPNPSHKHLKENANIANQNIDTRLYRLKNNFVLEKGYVGTGKKNVTAPSGDYELKKTVKER